MTFNKDNRRLTSSTGYLRDIRDGWVVDHEIYLGKADSPDNYEEITAEEYETANKAEEEKNKEEGAEA